jgi:hypothetical protein
MVCLVLVTAVALHSRSVSMTLQQLVLYVRHHSLAVVLVQHRVAVLSLEATLLTTLIAAVLMSSVRCKSALADRVPLALLNHKTSCQQVLERVMVCFTSSSCEV